MTPEDNLLCTIYRFPYGAIVNHDSPSSVVQWYAYLERMGFLIEQSKQVDNKGYVLTIQYWITNLGIQRAIALTK